MKLSLFMYTGALRLTGENDIMEIIAVTGCCCVLFVWQNVNKSQKNTEVSKKNRKATITLMFCVNTVPKSL